MIRKAFVALLLIAAFVSTGIIASQTYHFWNGGIEGAARYIQFKMMKQ